MVSCGEGCRNCGACDGSRNLAREQIVTYRAPAVVGTGWLKHYPLAFGYAERSDRAALTDAGAIVFDDMRKLPALLAL